MGADQANPQNQIAALRVMAMVHAQHKGMLAPSGMTEPNPALHYLHKALAVASTIDGYTVPGELYDAMAHEYASAAATSSAPTRWRWPPPTRARKPTARKRPTTPSPCRSTTRPNTPATRVTTTANWPNRKRAAPKYCSAPAPRSNGCRPSARRSRPTSTPKPCSARSTATSTAS
ncbi:hypothetical protein LP419_06950 [Massilia sp. H-1]|nr:hypothetical protein LP419_06950 [Massilia sp. H-1]